MYIPEFLECENLKIDLFGLMHSIGKSIHCGRAPLAKSMNNPWVSHVLSILQAMPPKLCEE